MRGPVIRLGLFLLLSGGLLAGCGDEAAAPAAPPRPVVTMPLVELRPNPPLQLTGVAEPYREAEVSFEVSGRIQGIANVGRSVQVFSREKTPEELGASEARPGVALGRGKNRDVETLHHEGDVIAWIDDTSYRQRWEAARLRLRTAEAGRKAQELDRDEVAPKAVARAKAQRDAAESEIASAQASIQSAQSNKTTAENDLDRNRKLLRDKQISKAEFDQYQNAFTTADANLSKARAGLRAAQEQLAAFDATLREAEAALELKAANVRQTIAQIEELQVAVAQAKTDLDRCILRAPFSGRITEVHSSQGDFVAAGKPVLRLTLIDPIKVSVTVSARREREILPGSHARVEPRQIQRFGAEQEALFGTVFEKGAVADPATRTFRVDVLVRNARRRLTYPGAENAVRLDFRGMLPAVERHFGEGGPLYVCRQCFVDEGDKQVLYRIKGAKFSQPRTPTIFEGPLELERIEVKRIQRAPEDFMQILNWSFQRAEPVEGEQLGNGDLLLNFQYMDPSDVGRGVVLDRFEWAIRPGDLVPVRFDGTPSPKGFWVPDGAIRAQNDKRSIFVVEGGTVRELPVTVHDSVGSLRHIRGDGLRAGLQLVTRGMHYVFAGAQVSVTTEEDLREQVGKAR